VTVDQAVLDAYQKEMDEAKNFPLPEEDDDL
jgi:hypothetical protein